MLPVGISFYTFQALSYVIDVYWQRTPARRSLLDVAAFIAFFPNLLAGPIMRATTLLPQIERERRFSASAARDATLLLAWGFFKKLVIADNVGVIANKVFALQSPEFFVLWAGVFAFGIQIYADFSAYADIARGVAKWLGIDLVKNFEHPYLAKGPTEFWRRWNISLSTWFRDYVFLPVAYRISDRIEFGPARAVRCRDVGVRRRDDRHHADGRALARRQLELRHLGRLSRRAAGPRARSSAPPGDGGAGCAGGWPCRRSPGCSSSPTSGWLFFRETDLAQLVRHLGLSPFESTVARPADRRLPLLPRGAVLAPAVGAEPLGRSSAGATSSRP